MKTILVDAVDTFVIEGEGIFQEMYKLLETYPNKKIILSNANDEDVIYFEHNEEAVKSAQSVGITSYHYDKDKKDLIALKNFLDNNL